MAKKASKKRKTAADIPVIEEPQDECTDLVLSAGNLPPDDEMQDDLPEENMDDCTDLAVIDERNYDDFFSDPEEPESEPENVTVEATVVTEAENVSLDSVLSAVWAVNEFANTQKLKGEPYKKSSETDDEAAARTLSEAIARRKDLDSVLAATTSVANALKKAVEKASGDLDEMIYSICFDGRVSTERAKKYFNERPLLAEIEG